MFELASYFYRPSRSETHLEDLTTFISGSSLASSYIYKGVEPLSDDELDTAGQGNTRNPKEATRVIPGCETFPNNMPSLLSTKDQAMCLIALKIMQSGIPKDKLNADDIDCINLYNVRLSIIFVHIDWNCVPAGQKSPDPAGERSVRCRSGKSVEAIFKKQCSKEDSRNVRRVFMAEET